MATQYTTCPTCMTQNVGNVARCTSCGTVLPQIGAPMQAVPGYDVKPPGSEKKLAAGLCGILLGGFGVHKFILGYTNEGVIMLVTYLVGLFLCGIPSIIIHIVGIVEGIMYLTKSDEEFSQTYIMNKKPWF